MTRAESGDWLAKALVCPQCRGELRVNRQPTRYECPVCEIEYAETDGVPSFVNDEVRSADPHKQMQASFFDDEQPEWEVERPCGAPRLYRWLLTEKFRRSVSTLGTELVGATALTVCGGSGMDAEFLARAGLRVAATDLSTGAARRSLVRSERHHVRFAALVADVESLPFTDESFDVVYAHDGLHHLADPYLGISEMVRVARRAVSITEPASALVTRAAGHVGLSESIEEAGNPVQRLSLDRIERQLEQAGFRVVRASRYAMFYRHRPGSLSHILSAPGLFELSVMGLRAANTVIGRFGNKLNVQAVRET